MQLQKLRPEYNSACNVRTHLIQRFPIEEEEKKTYTINLHCNKNQKDLQMVEDQ